MNRHELLERYEIRGDETDYLAAKPLYEQAVAGGGDPQLLLEYGYLLECHARNELRQAVARYRRAVELDPDFDKAWYQLIHALAALGDSDEMIALHQRRLAEAPQELREYRFLAEAHLVAGRSAEAREVIDAGLRLAPDDRMLLSQRGEAKASTSDPDGALADWHHALDLDNSDIGPLFSAAYLLEREGRSDEAIQAWQSILTWHEQHGDQLGAEFPQHELARVSQHRTHA
jgi:tetratricopeptide (TPR) repeat protein